MFKYVEVVNERRTLLDTIGSFDFNLLENTSIVLKQILLYGNVSLSLGNNSN